jgi:hypothetical protein
VLEDLCAEGFKMAERRQGLDLAHSQLVMRLLARFHAASVVLHDQDPKSMSIYDQSLFSEPAIREGIRSFVSGTYYLSELSLLTQLIIKLNEISRRKFEFRNFCNVTPCGLDRKIANYGPLSYDIL